MPGVQLHYIILPLVIPWKEFVELISAEVGKNLSKTNWLPLKRNILDNKKVSVITFYYQIALACKQRRDISVFESSCHLSICLSHKMEASHCSF